MAECQLKAKNEYVWKDDLRGRIDKIMGDATMSSYKDFSERLVRSGIIYNFSTTEVKTSHTSF